MNIDKNTQLENQFKTSYVNVGNAFQSAINGANSLIGIPEELKITTASALLRALTYEMDITFKVKKSATEGELGLEIPEGISEERILSQNRISKIKSRLATADENKQKLNQVILDKAQNLEFQYPGHRLKDYINTVKSLYIFKDLNSLNENQGIVETLLRGFNEEDRIKFLLFVCPPVDYTYLQSDNPEDYIRTSTSISLLKDQLPRISELFEFLNTVGIKSSLDIFIGDDDDEKYIAASKRFKDIFSNLKVTECLDRKYEFLLNLEKFLKANRVDSIDIKSLSSIKYKPNYLVLNKFSEQDFEEEMSRMRELWKPNGYYTGLVTPTNVELRKMAEAKFATYAAQGELARSFGTNQILIQTERPPKLRTKMLNASLAEQNQIPAIYPFNK